jgi:putative SOS response-associated peptidase YedK
MCGRIVQTFSKAILEELFGPLDGGEVPTHYNLAPTQPLAIVRELDGRRVLGLVRWGLIPADAKDPAVAAKLINARAETLDERPSFRGALRGRRCIVPAQGFYEWQHSGGQRDPLYYHRRSGQPLALAGLWEAWRDPGGQMVETATIVTVAANALVAAVHNRMPAILLGEALAAWLDPQASDVALLKALLVPAPADELTAYRVGLRVNNTRNDGPECIEPDLLGPAQQKLF